jgi:hypothetical protein
VRRREARTLHGLDVHVGVVDLRRHDAVGVEFHDLHLAFNRRAPPRIHPFDPSADPYRAVGEQLEVHVRIPARVVADVLDGVEAPDVGDRAIDLGRDLDVHGPLNFLVQYESHRRPELIGRRRRY